MAVPPKYIGNYNGDFIGQLKLNGSCGILPLGDPTPLLLERHNLNVMSNQKPLDYKSVFKLKTSAIIIGEYMNKNKRGFDGKPFNHVFVINDIIAVDGVQLIHSTLEERMLLLDKLLIKPNSCRNYLYKYSDQIYRVQNINSDFAEVYEKYTIYDMVEGLVLKKKKSRLADCSIKNNSNHKWMFKFRKSTENYAF